MKMMVPVVVSYPVGRLSSLAIAFSRACATRNDPVNYDDVRLGKTT